MKSGSSYIPQFSAPSFPRCHNSIDFPAFEPSENFEFNKKKYEIIIKCTGGGRDLLLTNWQHRKHPSNHSIHCCCTPGGRRCNQNCNVARKSDFFPTATSSLCSVSRVRHDGSLLVAQLPTLPHFLVVGERSKVNWPHVPAKQTQFK